jgi:hypothetical protein
MFPFFFLAMKAAPVDAVIDFTPRQALGYNQGNL